MSPRPRKTEYTTVCIVTPASAIVTAGTSEAIDDLPNRSADVPPGIRFISRITISAGSIPAVSVANANDLGL